MLFLTATCIGLMTGLTRSIISVVAVAFLIFATFLAASIASGSASYMNLLIAVLGFNAGLINLVIGSLLVDRVRHA